MQREREMCVFAASRCIFYRFFRFDSFVCTARPHSPRRQHPWQPPQHSLQSATEALALVDWSEPGSDGIFGRKKNLEKLKTWFMLIYSNIF